MHIRLCKPFWIIGAAALALLVIAGVALFLLSLTLGDFDLPPQDCNGTSFHLSGAVKGTASAVVSVKGEDKLHGESGAVNLDFLTDTNGKFDSGTTYLPVFICESLQMTITAQGFVTQSLDYVPLNHFSEIELGTFIKGVQPFPVHLDIELQPSK